MSLSAAQVEQRRTGLGCSELYPVLTNPYAVWHQKVTGRSRFTGEEDFIRFGHLFERPTAEDYAYRRQQAGSPVRLLQTATAEGEGVTLPHPSLPWLMGTPDFLPALVRVPGLPGSIPDLATVRRLMDAGALDRGLEIKTGAAVAEGHLEEADRWGNNFPAGLVETLAPHCQDPGGLALELMRRYSLQSIVGVQPDEAEEDAWGEEGSAQLPRRYIVQCLGYMAITGLRRWDLHRLRFGWGRLETATYQVQWDEELAGNLLEHGARFVRDHLIGGKPPEQKTLEEMEQETARLFPKDNGVLLSLTLARAELLETFREAHIGAKRAEVVLDVVKDRVAREIGEAAGIDGGKGFKVTYGHREGKVTHNVAALVAGLKARLVGRLPEDEVEQVCAEALAEATKVGEGYRQFSRPQSWTKGLEAEVLAAMKESK